MSVNVITIAFFIMSNLRPIIDHFKPSIDLNHTQYKWNILPRHDTWNGLNSKMMYLSIRKTLVLAFCVLSKHVKLTDLNLKHLLTQYWFSIKKKILFIQIYFEKYTFTTCNKIQWFLCLTSFFVPYINLSQLQNLRHLFSTMQNLAYQNKFLQTTTLKVMQSQANEITVQYMGRTVECNWFSKKSINMYYIN